MAQKRVLDSTRLLYVRCESARKHVVLCQQRRITICKTSGLANLLEGRIARDIVGGRLYSALETRNAYRAFHNTAIIQSSSSSRNNNGQISAEPNGPEQRVIGELEIPHETASHQTTTASSAGLDTFAERADVEKPEDPSLPRTTIPVDPANAGEEHELLSEKGINQDVYYTQDGDSTPADHIDASGLANPAAKFTPARISAILRGKRDPIDHPYRKRQQKVVSKPLPEMLAAEEARKRKKADADGKQSSSYISKA